MPRAKGPAQPPRAAQGLPYGQGQAMADAQRAIPLPDNRKATSQALGQIAGAPPTATPLPPGIEGGGGGPVGMEQALAMAQMMPPPTGSLTDPTTRPGEPLTAGLPSGPGPGPAAVQADQQASVAAYFAIAAQVFGNDPRVARMAQRARQRGL